MAIITVRYDYCLLWLLGDIPWPNGLVFNCLHQACNLKVTSLRQGLIQDLESGCLILAIVKFLDVQIFKEDHNILRFQP